MERLTTEQIEKNRRAHYKEKVKRWNESFCATCPLMTERAKQDYLQLGAFRCDDPMSEIWVLSRTYPANTIDDCDIVNSMYELYNVSRLKVNKLLKLIEENPNLLKLIREVNNDE